MAKTKLYHYRVRFVGQFPIDMLRYDSAWPRNEVDASVIHRSLSERSARSERDFAELTSYSLPTAGRWESFGCYVSDIETRTI